MRFLIAISLTTMLGVASAADVKVGIPPLRFEKYTLPNGLDVILHEDHSIPIVAVDVWYHVGSKNEQPGRTGFAHLFEHMMFQGTKHHDNDYFLPLQEAGGWLNGTTSQDRTNYFETVPSNYLELALWMESDRMGFLLPAMTQERLDNQRSVVKNERRQSYENRPYGLVDEVILAAMYPPEHPYSWSVIGSMADLDRASREDVAAFFRRYYHPANASLAIAGDFDPAVAKRLVAKYFGPIPAGPKVEKSKPMAVQLTEPKRIAMTDRVGLPRLYMVWPTAPIYASDEAQLKVLAQVLAGGKTSRLERALVRQQQIAQDVWAYQESDELVGNLAIVATARPGHTTAELEAAILQQLRDVQEQPPTPEEIARAVNRIETQLVRSLESVGGFRGRADRLNWYNVLAGDPGYMKKDFGRYLFVTPEGVQRVAKKFLGPGHVVLDVAPGKETKITPDPRTVAEQARQALAEKAEAAAAASAASAVPEDQDRKTLPQPAPVAKFVLPAFQRAKLSNGMEVLLVEKHALPAVALNMVFRAGRSSDPAAKLGLANLLAAMWDEGTSRRTAEQIADELAGLGASLSIGANWDSSTARLFCLKRNLGKALDVYADVLRDPVFPEKELAREKKLALGELAQLRDDPQALAELAVGATLYGPDHPYGQPHCGTPITIPSIARSDLEAFYRSRIRPDEATLIAVGDITLGELIPQLEKLMGGWRATAGMRAEVQGEGDSPIFRNETSGQSPGGAEELPSPPTAKPTRIVLVDKPGAAQSVISVAQIGAPRNSPDYHALAVMDSVLGGQFSSRLNMNLRESKGYTYGAHSMFDWRVRQNGPFLATSAVQTAVTAPAVVEFLNEFQGMAGARPASAKEIEFSKTCLTRRYPAGFETSDQLAEHLETLVKHRLPDKDITNFIPAVNAVNSDEVSRVAKQYLDPAHLAIVIVGDRAKIESSLRALPEGKDLEAVRFDDQLRLVPVPLTP